jgi:DNA polymerase-3 subunit delta'
MARAPILQEIVADPEADRLDGFAHPRLSPSLYGHAAEERAFAEAFLSGRVHHGWLLAGREGIGKATLAYRMARFVLARADERGRGEGPLDVPVDSVAARQVRALSHPDLLLIRRPYDVKNKRFLTVISVDEVRRIKSFLAHAAGPDSWRVVIVDQADELNINAANALLKSLEEPPSRVLFLLVTSEPGRLLTTIRSRCRRLELSALAEPDLRRAAQDALAGADDPGEIDEGQWPLLAESAHGSVRRLLALSRTLGSGTQAKLKALIGSLPRLDWPALHALADEMTASGAEQRYEQMMELLTDSVARLVRTRAIGAGAPDDMRLAERLIPEHALPRWAELWETIVTKKAETAALNLDKKALILETFARMQGAARIG